MGKTIDLTRFDDTDAAETIEVRSGSRKKSKEKSSTSKGKRSVDRDKKYSTPEISSVGERNSDNLSSRNGNLFANENIETQALCIELGSGNLENKRPKHGEKRSRKDSSSLKEPENKRRREVLEINTTNDGDADELICVICRDGEVWEDDEILLCDGCDVPVHQVAIYKCYVDKHDS